MTNCSSVPFSYGSIRGPDFSGELGDNTAIAQKNVPTLVDTTNVSAGSKFIDIRAAAYFSCALTDQHQVLCWGSDANGQLGNGGANSASAIPLEIAYPGL